MWHGGRVGLPGRGVNQRRAGGHGARGCRVTGSGTFLGRLGRFATWNVAQHVWLGLLSLVATPVIYHGLGEASYGILSIVTLAAAQLSILEMGFGHATIRSLGRLVPSSDWAAMSRIVKTSSWVFAGTGLVGFLVLTLGAGPLARDYFQLPRDLTGTGILALRIGAVFFVVSILGTFASTVWTGFQRFGFLNLVSGGAATVQLLGALVLVLMGRGVLWVVAWSVVAGSAALLVNVVWLRREVPRLQVIGRPDGEAFRDMARFGALLAVAGVLTQFFLSGGPLLLGHYVAVGALPFFTIPFGLYQRMGRMGFGLASALYPLVAELDGQRDDVTLRRLFLSGTRVVAVAGAALAVPAVLLARPFLTLWIGDDFAAQGGLVLELLFVAFALALVAVPAMELARGTGRAGWLVTVSGVLAAANLAGVALLAPRWGAEGAGIAFLVAQGLGTGLILALVGRRACLTLLRPSLLLFLGLAFLAGFGGMGVTSGALGRLVLAAVSGVGIGALGYAMVLSPDERQAIHRLTGRT